MTLQRMALLGAGSMLDSDAAAYIAAVEAADGQTLETGVRNAINDFILGCKTDGIWNAIKASCILAGARTLSGALVPLVGTAPTNFNFVSGDYNRKTGLVGNGSTKYLIANLAYNLIPSDNEHLAVYKNTTGGTFDNYIGGGTTSPLCLSRLAYITNAIDAPLQSSSIGESIANPTGFLGASRSASASSTLRRNSSSITLTGASATRSNTATSYGVFCANYSDLSAASPTSTRLTFYSIGEFLNLALLDFRVTTLINAIAAAIP